MRHLQWTHVRSERVDDAVAVADGRRECEDERVEVENGWEGEDGHGVAGQGIDG